MESHNVEVIVVAHYPFGRQWEKELLNWLTTIAQPAIDKQQVKTKKKFLKNWKHTPAIYLS